jgi:hypothetical protein
LVNSCGDVLLEAFGDLFCGAVGDHGIDELVAAGFGDVFVAETLAFPAVEVVIQAQVGVDGSATQLASMIDVGGENDLVLGRQEGRGPQQFSGMAYVLGGRQIRGVRPRRVGQTASRLCRRGQRGCGDWWARHIRRARRGTSPARRRASPIPR